MVSDKYNNNNNSNRWIPTTTSTKEEQRTNGWIEVVSKHSKRHPVNNNSNDPFAGMKSCVDYEQEIERLKQLVPKVTTNKGNNKHQPQGISRSTSPDTTHSSDSDNSLPEPQSVISKEERARFLAFVRSWTGDLKGGYGHHEDELMNNNSLWAEQLPWTTRPMSYTTTNNSIYNNNNQLQHYNYTHAAVQPKIIHDHQHNDFYYPTTTTTTTVQNPSSYPYYNNLHHHNTIPTTPTPTITSTSTFNQWEQQQQHHYQSRQQPIGMGRSSFSSASTSSLSSLKGRTNSPFVL